MEPKKVSYKLNQDRTMVAREVGSGDDILFLTHGMANNWYSWASMTKRDVDNKFTYVLIDSFGYGESDRLDRYSFAELVDALHEFVEVYLEKSDRSFKSVGFGGYSMGSVLTSLMSARQTELFDHYILMAPVFESGIAKRGTMLMKGLGRLGRRSGFFGGAYKRVYMSTPYSYFNAYFLTMHNFSSEVLKEYAFPAKRIMDFNAHLDFSSELTDLCLNDVFANRNRSKKHLVIAGRHDRFIDIQGLIRGETVDVTEDVTLKVIDNSGHSPLYEQPENVFETISEYIKEQFA